MTAKAIYRKLTEQAKNLEVLRSDLSKIKELLEQHRQAADEAKRVSAPFDEQATAAASMVSRASYVSTGPISRPSRLSSMTSKRSMTGRAGLSA